MRQALPRNLDNLRDERETRVEVPIDIRPLRCLRVISLISRVAILLLRRAQSKEGGGRALVVELGFDPGR
jgi:hypothetical protein